MVEPSGWMDDFNLCQSSGEVENFPTENDNLTPLPIFKGIIFPAGLSAFIRDLTYGDPGAGYATHSVTTEYFPA